MSPARVGIVGAGNVGSALVSALAATGFTGEVHVAARALADADAAVLDAASGWPAPACELRTGTALAGHYDVVVVTAGAQPGPSMDDDALLRLNLEIARASVAEVSDLDRVAVVLVGTPVDRLTEAFCDAHPELPTDRILGFGGELDRARLVHALRRRGRPTASALVVGEHGPNAIPVYEDRDGQGGGAPYAEVADEVRSVLRRIKQATGKARNLASGTQLARLVHALTDRPATMCLSRIDDRRHGLALTWPCVVGPGGIRRTVELRLGPEQSDDLDDLVRTRLELRARPAR